MSLKTKLASSIIAVILLLSVLVVGVLSVKQVNLGIGGTITFTAKGITGAITFGDEEGANGFTNCGFVSESDATGKLSQIILNTTKSQANLEAEFEGWTGLKLTFLEDNSVNDIGDANYTPATASLKFTIYNSGEKAINVTVPQTVEKDEITVEASGATTIASGAKSVYVVTITSKKDVDFTDISFNMTFGLALATA